MFTKKKHARPAFFVQQQTPPATTFSFSSVLV